MFPQLRVQFQRHTIHGSRFYQIEGVNKQLPSVTTILDVINKPHLYEWKQDVTLSAVRDALKSKPSSFTSKAEEAKWTSVMLSSASSLADQKRDAAATYGTKAHNFIDKYLLEGFPHVSNIPKELMPVVSGFEKWRKDCGLSFIQQDSVVYSSRHLYAGAFDALARTKNGELVLIDWKTTSSIKPEHALQVAAYAMAFEEMTGEKIKQAWVVRFDKYKPIFETSCLHSHSIQPSFDVFLSALHLWKSLRPHQSLWSTKTIHYPRDDVSYAGDDGGEKDDNDDDDDGLNWGDINTVPRS
eukprot:TRINITY_DN119_c1_g1_i1.p1 TRINITY_DN119_c1_g1~~TRINITY_DN119_c1_g1_i1.p1  ORF type:complete len:298 (+),score=73.94 TRINITY_DN119_c1_g1_i1:17-910(+)